MKFNAQQYFRAAAERIKQARILYRRSDDDCYAIAMYTAGVAVECLLRAFKLLQTAEFDERHDLLALFAHSRMRQLNDELLEKRPSSQRASRSAQDISAWMSDVYNLWANDYRYASEDRLRSELTSRRKIHGVKGDVLKAGACRLLNSAEMLIERGAVIWTSLSKK
jgi:hypothetical protein